MTDTVDPLATQQQQQQLEKAVRLYEDDKLLEAGRILKAIDDESILEKKHKIILKKAKLGEALVKDLKSADLKQAKHNQDGDDMNGDGDGDEGWVIHGVSKEGGFPTLTAHKLEKSGKNSKSVELKARVETPIDHSMLSPFISVLNETELYETW